MFVSNKTENNINKLKLKNRNKMRGNSTIDNREMKGIIFSLEALLSLLILVLLISLLPLVSSIDNLTLQKFIYLSDVSEVLDKGFHEDFSFWTESGITSSEFLSALDKIYSAKGKRFYLLSGSKTLPTEVASTCEKDIIIDRLVITAKGWKKVSFILCKD